MANIETSLRSLVDNKQNCLFCNAQLAVSTRNCFNIFKTILLPLEKKACDLIGVLLDKDISEGSVHSEVVCKKCFKLVNEFADLESRVGEIKDELIISYKKTLDLVSNSCAVPSGKKNLSVLNRSNGTTDSDKITRLLLGRTNSILPKGISLKPSKLNKFSKSQVLLVSDNELHVEEIEVGEVLEDYEIADADHEEVVTVQIKNENDTDEYGQDQEEQEDGTIDEVEYLNNDVDGEVSFEDGDTTLIAVERHVLLSDNELICLVCPEENRFTCDQKDSNYMNLHLKVDHEIRLYICDLCGEEFKKRTDLSSHVDDHAAQDVGNRQCEQCHRVFSNVRLYRIHKRLHTSQTKSWACEVCGKKYSSRNLLEEHTNTHTGMRPYVCPHCGKDFASKYTFKSHLKTHEVRERNFSCSSCEKTFLSAQNLIQHEKTHSDTKDFVCDHCGKGFGSSRNLEVHSVVHSGLKPFICKVCGKAFARKAEIKDHERTHTGERPFQCEMCGAQFSQRSNLQSHKRVTHYDDRRYRCDSCGKGFKRRRLLDYHIKAVHTGERPFKCTTCEATFVYPEHFKKHVRIHTGVKPYKCEVCGKAFNSRDNRNAHRFVHSDKKPYECLVCGLGFMRKPLLYNHMHQAGHMNDTIVLNQPRLTTTEEGEVMLEREQDIEMTIVEDGGQQDSELDEKPKLYFTEFGEHVIIQGDEKTLIMADGTKIKTLDENEHIVDESQFLDLDVNIVQIEHLVDDGSIEMTAHINEHGQLVNEHGQIIDEHGQVITDDSQQPLIVDETVNFTDATDIIVESGDREETIKEEKKDESEEVHYVQIRLPESDQTDHRWLSIVGNEDSQSNDHS